ncbi:hypothetical protein D3C87_1987240 [compost metagenome]
MQIGVRATADIFATGAVAGFHSHAKAGAGVANARHVDAAGIEVECDVLDVLLEEEKFDTADLRAAAGS